MGIISYAQNFEDVMLWRVFKDVKEGFYIDVGANDPISDSVTNFFYENGWRGINVEPNRQFFAKLEAARPRDTNIFAAVTNFNGDIDFFEFDDTGLSTTEESLSQDHDKRGYKCLQVRVEALTLATIFERHVSGDVHFLKIDVEGGTRAVLEGLNFSGIRPWVIVCESVKPFSTDEDYEKWEDILLENAYKFVYADGINRFYLARERAEFLDCFRFPPNVFDAFTRYAPPSPLLAEHEAEQARLRAALAAQAESIVTSQHLADEARSEAAQLRQQNEALQAGVEERSQRIETLEARVAELTHVVVALEASVAERATQAQAMDAHVAALEREKIGLDATVAHLTAEAQVARTSVQDLEREKAGLEATVAQLAAEAQVVRANVLDLEREKAVQAQALAALEARAQSAEARLEQETSALKASLDLCAQATANTAQLMREKSGVETTLARTQERLQAAQSRIEGLDQIRQGLLANVAEQTELARLNGARAEHLETLLRRVAASLSWRITAPLRGWAKGDKGGNG